MQKGSAIIPILIAIGVLVIVGVAGAWYTRIIEIPGFPPPGCYYQQVQCIQAPCNPILVCDTPSPSPAMIPRIPSPSPTLTPIPTVVPTGTPSDQVCIQVITPAKDSQTGECREFPTPCDVPEGWEKVGSCSINPPIQLQ